MGSTYTRVNTVSRFKLNLFQGGLNIARNGHPYCSLQSTNFSHATQMEFFGGIVATTS